MHTFANRLALMLLAVTMSFLGGVVLAADPAVSGKVTLDRQPLKQGRVLFHLKEGQFVGSEINNGSYKVDRVPTGTYKVTIEGPEVAEKYSTIVTTTLQVTIREGDQEIFFQLQK